MRCALRTFWIVLCFGAVVPCVAQTTSPAGKFEVTETTIPRVLEAIRTGKVTCRQLVEAYLRRIEAYDQPTHLNAIVIVNPEALADADKLDREFAQTRK